ncbi:hypothetical protein GR198_05695 [Rhizobium leguminosarum]|jgi:site-specific DNA-cytosine methylase|uniref:DNA cytosine methyltransferase n=1 Tax=Rhizobium leguminosarum TaxID=384 RepID=UPI0013C1A1A9|nr:DNA cytosine methyltransferase [Rhizobium leguminosarum]NEH55239.1 hypothetical protein [Rhizobium leguminosarum]
MADIDAKAQALSAARARILKLQQQMTDRVLQMAAEVDKMMEIACPTGEDAVNKRFVPGLMLPMRARLQDFPDDWHFVGGFEKVAEQIDNAVCSG